MWRNEMQRMVCGFDVFYFHSISYAFLRLWKLKYKFIAAFRERSTFYCAEKKNYMEIWNQLRITKFHIYKYILLCNNFAIFFALLSHYHNKLANGICVCVCWKFAAYLKYCRRNILYPIRDTIFQFFFLTRILLVNQSLNIQFSTRFQWENSSRPRTFIAFVLLFISL